MNRVSFQLVPVQVGYVAEGASQLGSSTKIDAAITCLIQILTGGSLVTLHEKKEPASAFDCVNDAIMRDWNRVRALIEHEDNLIDQRTGWLLTINAFLLSGFFIAQSGSLDDDLKGIVKWSIPIIGIVVSSAVKIAISAAVRQLKTIVKWWQIRKSSDPHNFSASPDDSQNLRHPPIVGFAEAGHLPHDFMISEILPSTIISIWICILIGLSNRFIELQQTLSLPIWAWAIIFVVLIVPVWRRQIDSLLKRE
jgi:hypothetical protein